MRKQLRLITASRLAIDPWSKMTQPIPVKPKKVLSRHFRRHIKGSYKKNDTVPVNLHCGWYVLCLPNGRRILSALPF